MDGISTPDQPVNSDTPQGAELSKGKKRSGKVDLSVLQIIDRAENSPAKTRGALLLSIIAGVGMWASFPPLDFGPLAWLATIPWLILIRLKRPTRRMYFASYLGALCFTIPAFQWMRYGDPMMYFAWILLALYVAVYAPVFIGLSRIAVHRWGISLLLAAPLVWTGLEYLRGFLLTGFGWYFLGHTQHRWTELLQISDLFGAYGVSFIVMLFAAAISLQIPERFMKKLWLVPELQKASEPVVAAVKRPMQQLVIASLILVSVLSYGYFRRSQADFQPGPRVALIQGNFRAALDIPDEEYEHAFIVYNELTGHAVKHQPDLIVWPEGMFRYALQYADPSLSAAQLTEIAPRFPPESWQQTYIADTLAELSEKAGAAMVIGLASYDAQKDQLSQFNSAQLITPGEGLGPRYDKLHRVPFGEYIPGKDLPILSSMIPKNFGLTAGKSATLFEYKNWRFAPVICFEDTVPHVVRNIVHSIEQNSTSKKPVDFLVNLSNDGWFAGSSEHDQHLITAQFRAIECRMPLARAANMGISSVINGDGVVMNPEVFLIRDPVSGVLRESSIIDPETGRYRRKIDAVLVQTLPLDNRSSLYLSWGDWFAQFCLSGCIALIISRWIPMKKQAESSSLN
ncbi:MAG: apolipoprotein N-acyltransferase [Planctomycetaceae bacterium]|nr:apolipoprotein N-acyltransferase [Planctomycetaceae bacterium]